MLALIGLSSKAVRRPEKNCTATLHPGIVAEHLSVFPILLAAPRAGGRLWVVSEHCGLLCHLAIPVLQLLPETAHYLALPDWVVREHAQPLLLLQGLDTGREEEKAPLHILRCASLLGHRICRWLNAETCHLQTRSGFPVACPAYESTGAPTSSAQTTSAFA